MVAECQCYPTVRDECNCDCPCDWCEINSTPWALHIPRLLERLREARLEIDSLRRMVKTPAQIAADIRAALAAADKFGRL